MFTLQDFNTFAQRVEYDQKNRNIDSFAGGDGIMSRGHSVLDQLNKQGTQYRQSDFQSARFADPFQVKSRESTQVKQMLTNNEKQISLSQIDENEDIDLTNGSFRTTDKEQLQHGGNSSSNLNLNKEEKETPYLLSN